MAYGTIKVDTITFTDNDVDKSVSISGLVQNPTFSGNITVTGTVSGDTIQGQTVSGVTATGTTANFVSGVFTTQISGATVVGSIGNFTTFTGGTITVTSGVIASGTEANPSLSILGDANTGLYSPGADQLAISTGGSGQLFIAANGNIGVGTANPVTQFHIQKATDGLAGIQISTSAYGSTIGDGLFVGIDNDFAYLYNYENKALTFGTNALERLRITSTGTVNIVGAGTAGSTQAVSFNGSAPVNSLVLTSGGLVGVGVPGPTKNLEVGTSSGAGISIRSTNAGSIASPKEMRLSFTGVNSDGATPLEKAFIYAVDQQLDTAATFMSLGTAGTRAITIDSSQRVGIGTTTAGYRLDVAGGHCAIRDAYAQFWFNSNNTNFCGIYNAGSTGAGNGQLALEVNGQEALRVDSSKRLLVGTSTARSNMGGGTLTAGFQVEGLTNNNNRYVAQVYNAADVGSPIYIFAKSRGTSLGSNAIVQVDDQLGSLAFEGADGTNFVRAASITALVDGTPGTNDMPARLVFSTTADGASSPTERMRISNDGLLVTYGNSNCIVAASFAAAGTTDATFRGRRSATSTQTGVDTFIVYTNGNVVNTNNSYGAISDIKLKENIVDANSQWDDLKALQVRKYNFKEGQTHTQIGLIAQEVELVSPGLVSESPDRDAEGNDLGTVTKSVNYSVLYMKAVKALQEAMDRIETLEAAVTALQQS